MLTAGKSVDLLVRSFAKSNIRLIVGTLYIFLILSIVSIPGTLFTFLVSELYSLMEVSVREKWISW